MAEVQTPDAIPATNASNTTRYFHLPLFISTDKPSWLVDWNGAMEHIDTILEDINNASAGAVADVATITTLYNELSNTVQSLEATVQTAVDEVASMQTTVNSHETRMDAIETDLITQNNLIKTLSDAVTNMQATVATLNNRVQAMETTVSGLDTQVQSIQTSLTNVQSTLSTQESQIQSLDNRVTVLENAPTGEGMPFVNDLNFTDHNFNKNDFTVGSTNDGVLTFTVTSDSYIKVMGLISSVPGTLQTGRYDVLTEVRLSKDTFSERISLGDFNVIPLGNIDPAFANVEWDGSYSTGLYKVKAGTEIIITVSRFGILDTCNAFISVAPVE